MNRLLFPPSAPLTTAGRALDDLPPRGWSVGAATVTHDGRPVPFHELFQLAVAAFRPDVEIVGR